MKPLIKELWKIPFIRFIAPFILGIVTSNYISINMDILLVLSLFFMGLSMVYRPFLNHNASYHKRWIFGLLVSASIFFISFLFTARYNIVDTKIEKADLIIGTVDEPPQAREKSIKLIIKAKEFCKKDVWINDKSKILVYINKDSLANTIKYGDLLLLKATLNPIRNAGNPYEFDYKTYLNRKQIYFQSYQNSMHWQRLSSNKGNYLYDIAYSIRNKILNIYKNAGISGDEFAILSALTLGVKDYLSDEIVKNYSHSGAMHVLAVSGLHVGIITLMLNFLLAGFRNNPRLRIIYTFIVISFLWLFAIITGLTPSVTRSALMFTFYVLGQNTDDKVNSFNSLAASAFIILIINPNSLFHVGFQLSFLAVSSILLFQPKIYLFFTVKNRILDQVWQLTTVSIAAQIGTIPISIFYFHKFPIYALLSNIIVIPAAMIIMYLTVVILISSYFTVILRFVAHVLSLVVAMLNKSTSIIESMPFSNIENIGLSSIELIFIYLALLLLIVVYITKDKKGIFIILSALLFAFITRNYIYYNNLINNKLIVFSTNRKAAFASMHNKQMKLYADSSITNNHKSINYLCSDIMTSCSINNLIVESLSVNSTMKYPVKFIYCNGKRLAYLIGKTDKLIAKNQLYLDYVILGKNSTISLDNIKSLFDFGMIILDSSLPRWKQNIIEKECIAQNIECFNVNKNGAFVLDY